jgi:hypothetical protein
LLSPAPSRVRPAVRPWASTTKQTPGSGGQQGSPGTGSGSDGNAGADDGGPSTGQPSSSNVKRVFITAATYTGDLGGVDGADAKCNTSAAGALIGGAWRAWISDSTHDAIDRITDVGPWYLIDGKSKVFNNKANIQTVPLQSVSMTEQGTSFSFSSSLSQTSWAGTHAGTKKAPFCSDWTDGTASNLASGACIGMNFESVEENTYCTSEAHLICFEQ